MFTSYNLKNIFTFPFHDKEWKSKLAVLAILALGSAFILPSWLLLGYIYEIVRKVVLEGAEPELPSWEDSETILKNGFYVWLVQFIFSIPLIILMALWFGQYILILNLETVSVSTFAALFLVIVLPILLMGVFFVASVCAGIFTPISIGHMAAKESINAAFRIKEWWKVFRKNIGGFLLSYIVMIGFNFIYQYVFRVCLIISMFIWILLPIVWIAMIAVSSYEQLVMYALFAQAYREGAKRMEASQ